jgi:hypothetical protein
MQGNVFRLSFAMRVDEKANQREPSQQANKRTQIKIPSQYQSTKIIKKAYKSHSKLHENHTKAMPNDTKITQKS